MTSHLFPDSYPEHHTSTCGCGKLPSHHTKEFTGIKWTDDGPKRFTYSPMVSNEPSYHHRESAGSYVRKAKIVEINGVRKYYIDGKQVTKETFMKSSLL